MSTPAPPLVAMSPASPPSVEHVDKAASVKTYHQNLASHLVSMIRRVGTASTSDPSIPDPPPNPRQHSNDSLESESKISSGVTTDTGPSRKPSTFSATTSPDIVETNDKGVTRGISNLSLSRRDSDQASPSARQDLTARPTLLPPHFSPAHFDQIDNGAGPSHRSSPSHNSPRISPLVKPADITTNEKLSKAEIDTREQEHRRAWEAEGRRVWRHIPQGFELKLQPRKRAGSRGSSASLEASIISGPSGAGPGNAIRADDTLRVPPQASELDRVPSNATLPETTSEVSRPESPASVPKSHCKRPSTLQKRQDQLDHQDHEGSSSRGRSNGPSVDEQTRYLQKKAARLVRIEERLNKQIGSWWAGVQAEWADACSTEPSEIEPYCPSPGPEVTQLRFLPVDTDMSNAAAVESKTPTLNLPPLRIVGETRKNRLHLIDERNTESDVDLLIRLAEVNRIHAAGSRSFAPMPITRPRAEKSKVDDSRLSMNVRTTMATPKPTQYTKLDYV